MTNQPLTGSLAHQQAARPDLQLVPSATRRPRVAFVVCDAGGGHRSAARALTDTLHQSYPECFDTVTVAIEDMIGPIGKQFGNLYSGSYNLALQGGHYWLEPVIFGVLTASRKSLQPFGIHHVRDSVRKLDADLIVTLIHGAHDALFEAMRVVGKVPNLTVVTDSVSIRPAWVHPACEQVVVSTPEARTAVENLGIDPSRILLIGHPLDPAFSQPTRPVAELRRRYFLQDRFTIMMMMGGTGGRNIYRFSQALIRAGLPVQIIACCGNDQGLLRRMQALAAESSLPIKPLGYTTEISNLMAASDLLVTKPGPGTIMEAMARDLPMILDDSNYTMWQEKGNVDYVRENNLGRVIGHTREFIPAVRLLLEQPGLHADMKAAVVSNKRIDASAQIAALIHQRLKSGPASD